MNEHDQLREQMWDLVYGLTTAEETAALHARIKSDPKVARLYAEVRLEADLIAQAAKVEDAAVTLPAVEPKRVAAAAGRAKESAIGSASRGTISRSLHWLAALSASALAILMTVGIFWRGEELVPQDLVVVSVRSPSAKGLVAALPTELELKAQNPQGEPVSTRFKAQVANTSGTPLYEWELETDVNGLARLPMPGEFVEEGTKLRIYRQELEQSRMARTDALVRDRAVDGGKLDKALVDAPLPVQQEPIQAQVTFDKYGYDAGDVLRFRVVANSAFTRQIQDPSKLDVRLQSPDGQMLEPTAAVPLDGTGIVTGEFQLPADASGRYAFFVQGRPQPEASVVVEGPIPPGLEQMQNGAVRDMRRELLAMGGPAGFGGGGFRGDVGGGGLRGGAGKSEVDSQQLAKGALPIGGSRGALPGPAGEALADTRAAGTANMPAPAAPEPQAAQETRAPSESPTDSKQLVEQLENLVQRSPATLNFEVPEELAGKKVSVEAYYQGILLGKQALAPKSGEAAEKLVETAPQDARKRLAELSLNSWVEGELDLVYREEGSPDSLPLLRQKVMTPRQLQINLSEAKESYSPGERVQLVVEVKNALDGLSVPSAKLGVAVKPLGNDARDLAEKFAQELDGREALAAEKGDQDRFRRTIIEDRLNLRRKQEADKKAALGQLAQKDAVADAPADAAASATPAPPAPGPAPKTAEPQVSAALSVLADESQPPSPSTGDELALLDESKSLGVTPTLEGFDRYGLEPLLVASNEPEVRQVVQEHEAAQAAREAQLAKWRTRMGRLILAGGVLMLVVMGVAFALQRPARPRFWVPALGVAAASFVVGFVWILNQSGHRGLEVAKQESVGSSSAPGYVAKPMGRPMATGEVAAATDQEAPSEAPAADPSAEFMASGAAAGLRGIGPEGPQQDDRPKAIKRLSSAGDGAAPGAAAEQVAPPRSERTLNEDKKSSNSGVEGAESRSYLGGLPGRPAPSRTEGESIKKEAGAGVALEEQEGGRYLFGRKKTANATVWQPLLVADENGRAVIEFTMPEAPGDYRLVLDVHGLGSIGQLQTTLRCQPLPAAPAAQP